MSGEGLVRSRPSTVRFRQGMNVCPACETTARITGSERVSPLVKTLFCACQNVECGMTWRMQLVFEYVISPSAIAHELDLPRSPQRFTRAPPGSAAAPDPDQLAMFADEDGGDDGPEAQAAA